MSIVENKKKAAYFDPVFRIHEVCELLNVKRSTIYKLLADQDLSAIKYGRSTMICRSEIERYLATARPAVFKKNTVH
jgi:excisionase family DNA binding protein